MNQLAQADRLLSGLSITLLDAEVDEIPQELRRAFLSIAELVGAERLFFYVREEDRVRMTLQMDTSPAAATLLPPDELVPGEATYRRWAASELLKLDPATLQPAGALDPTSATEPGALVRGFYMTCVQRKEVEGLLGVVLGEPGLGFDAHEYPLLRQLALITQRALSHRRTLEALHREAYFLNTLMQNLPDAIYFKDRESRFLRVSRQIVEQNGLRHASELIGKTDHDLFTPEHAQQALADEQEIMRTGRPVISKEEKETWPDGRITWVLSTKVPLRDELGNVIGTFGLSKDITQLRQTQMELSESREMLRQRYVAMEQELERARVIQRALLPQSIPESSAVEVRYRYEPLDAVGGDFFSFMPLSNGSLAVFLGDLTGHGVSAALFMSLVKCATERVFPRQGSKPQEYLRALDHELCHQIPNGFITAIYGVFSPRADGNGATFTYAGAGHPEPILVRAATGEAEVLPSGAGALGIFNNFPREQKALHLHKGDRVYFYTDGIPETQNARGEMLGFDALPAYIKAANGPSLEGTLDAIIRDVKTFQGDAPTLDDIALIGIEIR